MITIANPEKYRAGLYERLSNENIEVASGEVVVSKDDELESGSISTQKIFNENFCKDRNIYIYDHYTDDGVSGATFDRPDFNRMIQDIENKKINIVDVAEDNDGFWSCHMSKGLADTEFLFLAGKTYLEKADKYVKTIREKCAIAEEAYRFSFVDFNLMNRYKK